MQSGAYGFSCHKAIFMGEPYWRMHWVVDTYGGRLRYPHGFSRDTEDENAAERFCKKHKIEFPK